MFFKVIFQRPTKKSPYIFKGIWKDESGQITFVGLLISMMLLTYAVSIILKCQKNSKEIKQRFQTYQCFHYLDVETSNYVHSMGNLNKAIWVNHKLIFIPATSAQAKVTQKTLTALQQIIHLSYVKNLVANSYCNLEQSSSYVKNLPYRSKLSFLLERKQDGTVPLAHKEWTVWMADDIKNKNTFALLGSYKIEDAFSSRTSLKTQEVKVF